MGPATRRPLGNRAICIFAATRPAGGAWGSPTRIEPTDWYMAGQNSVTADAAGNVTASWVVDNTSGQMYIHTATRPAGGVWGAPTNLGGCRSNVVRSA